MKKALLITLLFAFPFVAQAEEITGEAPALDLDQVPMAIGMPLSATETVLVRDATVTVTIPKTEYEALKKTASDNMRLIQKRNQLIMENEALAAELAVWKARLMRVLRCATIQEAIEELQLNQNAERKENKE